tara:strand:- start:483 stop:749 length:267 start_codon:yes stop_codon:yes gene_type:complete
MISNKLTAGEEELLVITMEECAKLVMTCSKILQFGKEHKHVANFIEEARDVLAMIELLEEYGMINKTALLDSKFEKRVKLREWSSLVR